MKKVLASVALMIFISGCDQSSREHNQSDASGDVAEVQVEVPSEDQSDKNDQSSEEMSITAKAVEILNMLVIVGESREGNGIDQIAASFDWQKLSAEQAAGGNAEAAYLALKKQEGGILVSHQGDKGGWSVTVMEAFDRDVFMEELLVTFSLEKITVDYLPAQETTYYFAHEKKSNKRLGVLALTTSDHPNFSGHATAGWLTMEQWNQVNPR